MVHGRRAQRDVRVLIGERVFTFRSKAEARRTLRRVLKVKRLPAEVIAQLEGDE
jgi:hypothetical protein